MASDAIDPDTAAAYWTRARLMASGDRSERLSAAAFDWAGNAIDEAVQARGERAISALSSLAAAAAGDSDLALLGAGPLEDLLHEGLDRSDLDLLEQAVRRTPRLREALSHVWWDEVEDEVAQRLRAFAP